ncbi:small glutamine-rich tetratricopeptide repeat-containing protein A [Melampsora americana]|nr:small glutamine-rich tetratricopeptide repeat-containing protein A [Melampsora americana]
MSTELKKKLVYGILEFLNQSISDGTIRSDDKESMEVAMQCISEAFEVEWSPDSTSPLTMKPGNLLSVFEVFVKTQKKVSSPGSAPSSTEPNAESSTAAPTESAKTQADELKTAGNVLLSKKDFEGALKKYTEAISLDPTNPVYYSNRAAAHSQLGANDEAIEDALKALEVDPGFVKAYSRLGHGYFSSCQYEKAVEAYEKGLELEPDNDTIRKSLATAKSKAKLTPSTSRGTDGSSSSPSGAGAMPDLASMMGQGGNGMPDLSALMNNPMMAQMAQSMMANGGLERMMQNPMVQQMMNSMGGGGGGMPDLSALMNNPAAREAAASLMGGLGSGSNNRNDPNNPNNNMFS